MPNTRALRRRIKSVQNTSQITKAMQMVAATKMRRAQNQALMGRPYIQTLNNILFNLSSKVTSDIHILLKGNNTNKSGILILSTNKSLCGALNTNLFRAIMGFQKDQKDTLFYSVGTKGRDFLVRTQKQLVADFENTEAIEFRQAAQIAKLLVESFIKGEIKDCYLVYPKFLSTLRQEPRIEKILPIDPVILVNEPSETRLLLRNETQPESTKDPGHSGFARMTTGSEYLFEPSADRLLDYILVHFVETKIYQALLESKASEHSARMIAMQNATDNAKELVEDLKLTYNQTRQEAITNQLLEITSAAAALG